MKRKGCGPQGLGSPLKQTKQSNNSDAYNDIMSRPIVQTDNKVQDFGGGAFSALYGGSTKALGKGLMTLAGKLAKNPKTANIAGKIQKAVKPNAGKSAETLKQEAIQNKIKQHQKYASKRGQRRSDGTRI